MLQQGDASPQGLPRFTPASQSARETSRKPLRKRPARRTLGQAPVTAPEPRKPGEREPGESVAREPSAAWTNDSQKASSCHRPERPSRCLHNRDRPERASHRRETRKRCGSKSLVAEGQTGLRDPERRDSAGSVSPVRGIRRGLPTRLTTDRSSGSRGVRRSIDGAKWQQIVGAWQRPRRRTK